MDQQTIDTYNTMAKEYDDETVNFWDEFPRTFIEKFTTLSGKKIVNIGSGPGRDGLLLTKAGKDVICIDASESMIELSKEKGLISMCASFDNIPCEHASCDGVWSYTALLHVPKTSVDNALAEISRIIIPSGFFALGLIEGDEEKYKESSEIKMPRWFSYYQKDEVIRICEKHGFQLVYFEMFKPGSKNYLNFIFQKV